MMIQSPAFAGKERTPTRFTGDGEDLSPKLTWSGVPEGAKELALICDDPDAPTPEPWVHWVIYKIPAVASGLAEHIPTAKTLSQPAGALQGKNSWGSIGYRGPAPPPGHGVHHYHFKLYALDATLDVSAGLDKNAVLAAAGANVRKLLGLLRRRAGRFVCALTHWMKGVPAACQLLCPTHSGAA